MPHGQSHTHGLILEVILLHGLHHTYTVWPRSRFRVTDVLRCVTPSTSRQLRQQSSNVGGYIFDTFAVLSGKESVPQEHSVRHRGLAG